MEKPEDDELKRLKRQFRIMNNDKNALMGAYLMRKTKQQKMIQVLQKEKEELQLELQVFQKRARKDCKQLHKLQKLLAFNENLEREIGSKKHEIQDLNQQIKELGTTINKLQNVVKSVNKLEVSKCSKLDSPRKCENKLDTYIKQFCVILAENRKSRSQVQCLLKDRKLFNEYWAKLITKYENGKRTLLELMDQSSAAFAQREEAVEKLKILKIKSLSKSAAHIESMTEMKRMLDLQTNLGEFLQKKTRKRIMLDIEKKEREKLELARKTTEEQCKNYTLILDQIKEFVGESDIQKISMQYLRQEEENFALFNYVNELNDEIESLNLEIAAISSKIKDQLQSNEEQSQNRLDHFENLRNDLQEIKNQVSQEDSKLEAKQQDLDGILKGLEEIFRILRCSQAPLLDLLGDKQKIDEHNVLLYLSVLETKLGSLSANYSGL